MGEPESAVAQISSRFPQLPQKPKLAPEQGTQEMLRGLSRSQRGQDHLKTATEHGQGNGSSLDKIKAFCSYRVNHHTKLQGRAICQLQPHGTM